MKYLIRKLLRLTQFATYFWPVASSICLGWLISSSQPILFRIISSLGIYCLVMAVFSFGSIEDAPLDALAEGKNPDNPISKGQLSIPGAWKLSIVLAFIGLILSAIGSRGTLLVQLGLLFIGAFYFQRKLRLRQSAVLDALGFSILTSFLPFLSAANLRSIHFGNNSLVAGSLAFFLCYATYYTMIESQEKRVKVNSTRPKSTFGIMIVTVLIVIASLFIFTFSGLVPAWISFLMLVLFLIMVYPQFNRRISIQTETYIHLVFANFQHALAIALITFFLATQIFNILR
jgi:4-hydroxybenzoate polyprenyltransferase